MKSVIRKSIMKFDWNNWNWGGKLVFLSAIAAIISQFCAWVDIGFASQNGFEQMTFLMLVFYIYPITKLMSGKPIMKWLSILFSIASLIGVLVYIDSRTIEFMEMKKNASGAGAVIFLFSSIGLLIGSIGYKSHTSGVTSPQVSSQLTKSFKFSCIHCNQHLNAEPEHVGQSLACPSCGGEIVVPSLSPPIEAQPLLKKTKNGKMGWVIGGSAAALLIVLVIAAIGASSGPTFDKSDPEGSLDKMAASVSQEKKLKFGMALMSIGVEGGSEEAINASLHGKTVDDIIQMATMEDSKSDDGFDAGEEAGNSWFDEADKSDEDNSDGSSNTNSTTSLVENAAYRAAIGNNIIVEDLEISLTNLMLRDKIGSDFYEIRASDGGVYLVADWKYKNATRKPISAFSTPNISLISPDGIEYQMDVEATVARATEIDIDEKVLSNLNPGITVKSTGVFEVSKELLTEPGWIILINHESSKIRFPVEGKHLGGLIPQKQVSSSDKNREEDEVSIFSSPEERPTVAQGENNLPDLKVQIEELNKTMDTQRAQYQAAIDVINKLTNFKKTPVREGSPEYYRCLEASKVIQNIESGAEELKAKKSRLEEAIKKIEE